MCTSQNIIAVLWWRMSAVPCCRSNRPHILFLFCFAFIVVFSVVFRSSAPLEPLRIICLLAP
ncbi:hypothetical protein N7447_001904 [Penicillium robsamsonii]|uniref:uncharacterized protein n=1 Tax=Penicillium robsamsonii TaxID=1792511 RepID=UPI0025479A42|nr:uncharacterized protein N7447_001904 [Penicillium robsamsonii]KAJ5835878.1 hypothetical protein N7447_001904 [Penicillium robsamsonii]